MKRHAFFVKERKARNAARQRRYRIKRKASRIKCDSKKRVRFLDVIQVIIQRRFSVDLFRASCTLSQYDNAMIKDMRN